jgi:hypothetical protein
VLAIVAASAVLLACGACSAPGRFVIRLKPEDIQQRIDARFPISRNALVFSIRLESPRVSMPAGTGRLLIRMEVIALVAGQTLGRARALASGGVRYDPSTHDFLVTDPRIEGFDATQLPAHLAQRVKKAVELFISRFLHEIAIYQLERSEHRLARWMLKRAWISEGLLHLELGI